MIALSDRSIQVRDKTNRPSSRSHTFRYFFCSNLRGNGNLLLFDFVGEWKPDFWSDTFQFVLLNYFSYHPCNINSMKPAWGLAVSRVTWKSFIGLLNYFTASKIKNFPVYLIMVCGKQFCLRNKKKRSNSRPSDNINLRDLRAAYCANEASTKLMANKYILKHFSIFFPTSPPNPKAISVY